MNEINGSLNIDSTQATRALAQTRRGLEAVDAAGAKAGRSAAAGMDQTAQGAQRATRALAATSRQAEVTGKDVAKVGAAASEVGGSAGGLIASLTGPLGLTPALAVTSLAAIGAGTAMKIFQAQQERAITFAERTVQTYRSAAAAAAAASRSYAQANATAAAGELPIAAAGAQGIRARLEQTGLVDSATAGTAAVGLATLRPGATAGAESAASLLARSGRMDYGAAVEAIRSDQGMQALLAGGGDPARVAAMLATRQAGRLVSVADLEEAARRGDSDPTVRAQRQAQRMRNQVTAGGRASAARDTLRIAGEESFAATPQGQAAATLAAETARIDAEIEKVQAKRRAMEVDPLTRARIDSNPITAIGSLFIGERADEISYQMFGGGTRGEIDKLMLDAANAQREYLRRIAEIGERNARPGPTAGGGQ